MGEVAESLSIEAPKPKQEKDEEGNSSSIDEDEVSPIEQVRLTVPNTDDPDIPVWTFRMWVLGLISCILLSFLNQFFAYRREPLIISQITVVVATLPIGRFMAATVPTTQFHLPGLGSRKFSVNPGPFNMKEHVLISIFANAGAAFGGGSAYAVGIVNIITAFYGRKISFFAAWLLITTTQVNVLIIILLPTASSSSCSLLFFFTASCCLITFICFLRCFIYMLCHTLPTYINFLNSLINYYTDCLSLIF